MRGFALGTLVLGGCLYNHSVEVDQDSVEVARGTSNDVRVLVDGLPLTDLGLVAWDVDDPSTVTVLPARDNERVQIGGNLEGETVVHINVHGQTIDLPTRVGPPAILKMWIEPAVVTSSVGGEIAVHALGLDTIARIVDITHDSRWVVRDPGVAELDAEGMMLHANSQGQTTLHATNGLQSTFTPITIVK